MEIDLKVRTKQELNEKEHLTHKGAQEKSATK